ncbi:putative polysaccharide biosynthesis protein [Fructilactobacillus fructivorans]|uniref:Low temperature requirement B protein n=1 Tax=Fructilactobacillus fructivorans TaxID=1614 RepID=A0A0C1LWT0_9LACO|nr:polysaccharide biosynthesis protein [Fructilactobacillus fructivorans]KID41030.1 Low temperature requirement B protein [Fructilactobacillus fructivorans]MCT0151402.1 polysaccharide biosynthesis protein [Fructilactobacillus fructivorans]MCT2866921.1 polysaccharide biosynthesis protein [Fructilactobacillus fructivorans]MCT2869222.1 polysaccharide biosynthesis protein [Fructilactobacillus fructivorans]MCT2873741.1 polysaccharide biosynthesis protein [Fructilactobacillus fructivorans]
MNQKTNKKIISGTLILSIAAIISKVLSAVYRIPLENFVGNVGFYIYQQVYPIYGIGVAFALTGLPAFISKLIVERDTEEAKQTLFFQIMVILTIITVVIFAGLQLFSSEIATLMGDLELKPVIQAVSWMFLLMPLLADIRGYYQSSMQMIPTATSQVVEQVVRVAMIIVVAYLAAAQHWNLYHMGTLAMLSAPVAAVFAAVILLGQSHHLFRHFHLADLKFNYVTLTKQIVLEGGVLSILAALMVLMQLVDSFTVKNGLVASGLSNLVAQTQKGIYDRAQPIVQLGLVIGTAISSTVLPQMAYYYHTGKEKSFKTLVKHSMRITLVVTMAVTFGLISIMPQLNHLLFGSYDLDLTLAIYCLSILFATMVTAFNSVLQSINNFKSTAVAIFGGLLCKLALTRIFVVHFGIMGASLSTIIALAVVLLVNWYTSPKQVHEHIFRVDFLIKVAAISIVMMIVIGLLGWLLNYYLGNGSRLMDIVKLMVVIPVGAIVFLGMCLKGKVLSASELEMIPILNRFVGDKIK